MLQYYILKQGRKKKTEFPQLPINNCFSINQRFLLDVDPPSCFSAKRNLRGVIFANRFGTLKNLHTMTANGIAIPSRGSKMAIEPLSASSLNGKVELFGKSTIPPADAPLYVSKFVNHLMSSGKKGVAIALFVTSLRLFLKELQQDKRVDTFGRSSMRFEDAAFSTPSMESTLKSLVSTNFLSLLQRPGKNLLGLGFFPPSPPINNHKVPFLFESRKNKILRAIPSLARKLSVTEEPEVREADISAISSRSVLYCQEQLPTRNRSVMNGKSRNTISLQSLINQRVMPVGLGSHPESKRAQFLRSSSLLSCLESALGNVEPNLEIRKKKISGITRQIPCIVSKSRGEGLAIRWVINAAQGRRRKESQSFPKSLAEELVNAYYKKGEPRQKRDSLHKLAESNRSFLRYRWW
jgi:ribosomal protein S7